MKRFFVAALVGLRRSQPRRRHFGVWPAALMEYRLGAMASFLAGPRTLRCAIVASQGGSTVTSSTVGKG